MARLSYRGYNISLKPLKTDNLWQLELEKNGGEIVHTYTMESKRTLFSIECFAYGQVDKKIKEQSKPSMIIKIL